MVLLVWSAKGIRDSRYFDSFEKALDWAIEWENDIFNVEIWEV